MPTFPTQEEVSEASPLQYKQPIYISDKPDVEALLGESKRSSTKLPDRNSLLVDLGNRINLIGRNTANEFISAAHVHGRKAKTTAKSQPLYVHGVGSGSAQCKETLAAAVAVQYEASAP